MSLRRQVALLVSIAVILTCGVMFVMNIVLDRKQTLEKSDEGLRLLSLYMAGQLSNRFANVSAKADQLAMRITDNVPSYSKECYDLMDQYYALDANIYGGAIAFDKFQFTRRQELYCLFVARNAETGEFERGRLDPDYNYLDPTNPKNSWFTMPKTTGESFWTLPFHDEGGGNVWMFTYAAPFRRNGEFIGTVNVDVSLTSPVEWMRDILASTPSEVLSYGSCFLTDGKGVLISHVDTKTVEERRNFTEFLIPENGTEIGALFNQTDGGQSMPMQRAKNYFDNSGNWVRMVRAPVGETGWYLYSMAEEKATLQGFYGRLYRSLIWAGVMLAIFLWGLSIFTRRLTKPLYDSMAFATRLRDGNLGDRMVAPHQLECGKLVNSLNDMAETLERRTRESELALVLRERIFNRVAIVAEELTGIAGEIHTQSGEGVRDANEQQTTFTEFGAVLDKFDEHTAHTATVATRADSLLQEAREYAVNGTVEMDKLKAAMSDLVKSSADISGVLKTIDGLAFQTNLLSLNAAVEAARAGKYGRGFGVVAEEVRQLANRSAKAATETNVKLRDSEQNAAHGVTAGNQTAETLESIRLATENTAELISEVARLSNEQATMVKQVLAGLRQVEQIADGNRKRAEVEANTAEILRNSAEELKEILFTPERKAIEPVVK